jgi:FeS assembly SUF system protein
VGLPNPADASASGNPELHAKIVATLKTIYDPEIPVNLWDMGLIYGIAIEPTGAVGIVMTLTSPWCPEAGVLPPQIESAVKGIPGVTNAKVAIVWEPPWDPSRMSEAARLQLGMM